MDWASSPLKVKIRPESPDSRIRQQRAEAPLTLGSQKGAFSMAASSHDPARREAPGRSPDEGENLHHVLPRLRSRRPFVKLLHDVRDLLVGDLLRVQKDGRQFLGRDVRTEGAGN